MFTFPLVKNKDWSSLALIQAQFRSNKINQPPPAIPTPKSWKHFKLSCDTNLDPLVLFHLLPKWQSVVRYPEWHVPQGVVAGKNDAAKFGK